MAVVTYTVTVSGSTVTVSPDTGEIDLVERDYLIFNRAPDTTNEIKVKLVGGDMDGQIIIAVRGKTTRVQLLNPTLDSDGSVLIRFGDVGGNNQGFPP